MNQKWKNEILCILLNKDAKNIDQEKYQEVICALAMNNHVNEICNYIFEVTRKKKEKKPVYHLSTGKCVELAYEYLMYLQNMHEYAHEEEQHFLAR